ncbi:MAG: IclR family transcriptional regulator [Tissierellaceae bacterium]|nr:IclR family transcriptional regulator [Tissierellaceae bacterium]
MQLVERTLDVLLALSTESNGLSVSELAEKLSLPNSSTHRILATLKKNHFVMQSSETKKYRLGYKVLTLSSNIIKEDNLTLTAKPHMKVLANKINKTIALCVMEGESVVCLDYVESKDTYMFMVRTGFAMPPHATSAGKAIQAFMPIDQVQNIYLNNHEEVTSNTLTDFKSFLTELGKVRQDGYAVSDEELQIGVQGAACPIFDYNGRVIGSLSFTALKSDNSITDENIELLKECAKEISKSVGG